MAKYKPYTYDQVTLLPVSFNDQIQAGTFEYTLSYIIDHKIDLLVFEHKYSNDDEGRPAIHPGLLLKAVLYAYSKVLWYKIKQSTAPLSMTFLFGSKTAGQED
jgi:transposase